MNWKDALSDEFKDSELIKSTEDINVLVKTAIDSQKKIGEMGEKLGKYKAPESPEAYGLDSSPNLDEKGKRIYSEISKIAHKHGLPVETAKNLFGDLDVFLDGINTEEANAAKRAKEEALTAYKEKLGEKFDEKVTLAKKAAAFFGEDAAKRMDLDDPLFINLLSEVGTHMKEDNFKEGGKTTSSDSQEVALEKIKKFNADPEKMKAYLDPNNPQHKAVVEERAGFYKEAYPGVKEV